MSGLGQLATHQGASSQAAAPAHKMGPAAHAASGYPIADGLYAPWWG